MHVIKHVKLREMLAVACAVGLVTWFSAQASLATAGQDGTVIPRVSLERGRQKMVAELRARGITDARVISAMEQVPRDMFVPPEKITLAYTEDPLSIGHNQTISAPFIVALMTQLAQPRAKSRALDIGTGSGYQAAILSKLCREVYSVEIVRPLANAAERRLNSLGYKNISVRCGDGYQGWPEHAPFDLIVVAAAPNHVPQPLIDQLAPGGHLVIPVGEQSQQLVVIEKQLDGGIHRNTIRPVQFVPMTGEVLKLK
jgi:protein-L-isoaspartate(D-aspartate) O-methyltransferase